jgi:hypothetical protein
VNGVFGAHSSLLFEFPFPTSVFANSSPVENPARDWRASGFLCRANSGLCEPFVTHVIARQLGMFARQSRARFSTGCASSGQQR